MLALLRQLVNKSLVTVERSAEGEVRYRFLETIREFARQRLAESGEVQLIQIAISPSSWRWPKKSNRA